MKNYFLDRHEEKQPKEEGVAQWDFWTALGDTIREKYEGQYVKVVEVSNVVNRKPLPQTISLPVQSMGPTIYVPAEIVPPDIKLENVSCTVRLKSP